MGRQEERSAGGTGCEERTVSKVQEAIWENKKEIERLNAEVLESEEQMKDVKRKVADKRYEKEFQEYLASRKSENYEYLRRQMVSRVYTLREEEEDAYRKLGGREKQLYQRISEPYILNFYPGQRAI